MYLFMYLLVGLNTDLFMYMCVCVCMYVCIYAIYWPKIKLDHSACLYETRFFGHGKPFLDDKSWCLPRGHWHHINIVNVEMGWVAINAKWEWNTRGVSLAHWLPAAHDFILIYIYICLFIFYFMRHIKNLNSGTIWFILDGKFTRTQ